MGSDKIFKSKTPKRYIQIKSQLINEGTQMIAICTDVTRIKELEHLSKKMRAMFFSSIAHELRTPLNSIIPMIKMILERHGDELNPRVRKCLQIVLNSSLHL